MVGCGSLLGRVNREFLVAKPSMFRIAWVRSRAAAASALPVKRRRLGQEMEIVLGDSSMEERDLHVCSGILPAMQDFGAHLGGVRCVQSHVRG